MPELDSLYPSKYLRASDLNGKRTRATIATTTVETVGQGRNAERKLVLTFDESAIKSMILNKTNSYRIGELTGSTNYDEWIGAAIALVPTTTEFQGKVVPCIRIDAAPPVTRTTRPAPAHVPDQIDEAMPTRPDGAY